MNLCSLCLAKRVAKMKDDYVKSMYGEFNTQEEKAKIYQIVKARWKNRRV
jgi:hypothetical protein